MAEDLRRPAGRHGPRRDSGRPKRAAPASRYLSPPPAPRNGSGHRSLVTWVSSPWVWIVILALAGGFQYLRGAPADGVPFTLMLFLLAADTLGFLGRLAFRAPAVPRAVVITVTCVLGLVVVISPIDSALDRVVLILIGAGLFVLVWPDPQPAGRGRGRDGRVRGGRTAGERAAGERVADGRVADGRTASERARSGRTADGRTSSERAEDGRTVGEETGDRRTRDERAPDDRAIGEPVGGRARFEAEPPAERIPISVDALRHTGIVWGVIAVVVCIWEMMNFFLGLPSTAAADAHPTISSLVEPFVSWTFGRIVFVAVWLLAGLALLRKGRDR